MLWKQPQHQSKTSRVDMLRSPLYSFNSREDVKFHWRLQPTMGSYGVAGILFLCNWVWFWSLILEGKCCYFFFFLDRKLSELYLFLLYFIYMINKLPFSEKGSYQGNSKISQI